MEYKGTLLKNITLQRCARITGQGLVSTFDKAMLIVEI